MSAAVHHLGFAMHCRRDDMASTALQLERCLTDVDHCIAANRLKLNADKTELLWAGSRRCCLTLGSRGPKLQIGEDTIVPNNDVKVLEVTVVWSGNGQIRFRRLLGRILSVAATLTCSEVTGHGVGCNPCARLRHVPHRLLQCIVGWGTEGYNWQATASWMLQHVFSVARRSLIVDCPSACMSTFIGVMFRSE